MQYIEPNNVAHFYKIDNHPPALDKKITLLNFFRKYMDEEHLMKMGNNIARREGNELARLPHLQTWFCTKCAILLHLSNGTLQINFLQVWRFLENVCAFDWYFISHLGQLHTYSVPGDVRCDIYRPKKGCFHLQIFPFEAVRVGNL